MVFPSGSSGRHATFVQVSGDGIEGVSAEDALSGLLDDWGLLWVLLDAK
jgi:hypothetical protein